MNTITISGNLTANAVLFENETTKVANLRLANNGWDGTKQILNGYFNVAVFNPSEAIKGLLKGERVLVTGRLQSSEAKREDGTSVSYVKIVANTVARSLEFDPKPAAAE